ncbi:hypothetical protein HMPREF0971_03178 [Segatella oris F0302]|uniref:Uncharacterized protein n=1 Tax=Segatella oris F0302 TaxID=649760 RepID=D1QVY6_9BACT|nr:hypothetical protein HMPREF0971_03178 [Segatella oris F0302]
MASFHCTCFLILRKRLADIPHDFTPIIVCCAFITCKKDMFELREMRLF